MFTQAASDTSKHNDLSKVQAHKVKLGLSALMLMLSPWNILVLKVPVML